MKDISMMSPSKVAEQYGGDKRRIAEAMQMGLISPTVGVMAGMFIDRMRGAAAQEQADKRTVAQDVMAERGLASLPVDESMVPGGEGYAGGGVVAFANRGFVETPGGFNVLADEAGGDQPDLERARQLAGLFSQLYSEVPQGPASEEMQKFYAGSTERGERAAEKQRALAGLSAASALLGTRGPTSIALGAAGKAAAPGLAKAEEVASAAEEAGLKGRAALEEKQRAEKLKAIEGGLGLYGKEEVAGITAGSKSNQMKDYVRMNADAAQQSGDPRPRAVLEALFAKQYIDTYGAALMRGQAAIGGVGVQATRAGTDIEEAVTKSDEKINKEYNTQILMAETEAEKKRITAERDAKKEKRAAEIRRQNAPQPTSQASSAPAGLPPGATQIGTSGGKRVYQLPDGSRVIEQ